MWSDLPDKEERACVPGRERERPVQRSGGRVRRCEKDARGGTGSQECFALEPVPDTQNSLWS